MRCLTLLVVLASMGARGESRWGLRWRTTDSCIDAASLSRRVEARLGHAVFTLAPDFLIDGELGPSTGPKWRATLTLVSSAGDVMGSREVTSDGDDCHAIDAKLELVLAAMITPGAPPPPPPMPAVPPPPPTQSDDSVVVHLEADHSDARLMRVAGFDARFVSTANTVTLAPVPNHVSVCVAPCDERVSKPADRFFIGGGNLVPSAEFALSTHARDGRVALRARVGTQLGRAVAVIVISAGMLVGSLGAFAGLVSTTQSNPAEVSPGWYVAAGGAAVLTLGVVLAILNRTTVEFQ